jgi:HK97 family phage portal protein|nr:MAG TPA: portal protein [Caudoviricetes sp.]
MRMQRVIKNLIGGTVFQDVPHIDLDKYLNGGFGGGSSRMNNYSSKQSQLRANIGWVFAANSAISEECASVELKLYKKRKNGDREEIFDHEILDLLRRPNGWLRGSQFWSLYYQYMNLTGEAYILKMRNGEIMDAGSSEIPHALHVVPSHLASLILGDTKDDSYIRFIGKDIPLGSFIRDINPDPENPYRGRSVITASAMTLDTDYRMREWNRGLFANAARPSAVLEVPDVMTDETYERLRKQMDEAHAGSDNAFKQIILEGGAKLVPYSLNQQDLDFLASRKFSKDEIFAMFRTSPSIVGMTEDVNRANAEAQDYTMAKRVVLPRVRGLKELLNVELVEKYDPALEIDFVNPVPEDKTQALAEDTQGVNKWLTIDEVREKRGLPPLENGAGAVLYRPLNEVPIDMLTDLVKPETETTETPEAEEGEKSLKKDEDALEAIGEAKSVLYTRQARQYENLILRASKAMFNAQREDVLKWLGNALKTYPTASQKQKKEMLDDMADWEKYQSEFAATMKRIYAMIIEETGKDALEALNLNDDILFDPISLRIQRFLETEPLKASTTITEETKKQIRAALSQGMMNGDSLHELTEKVNEIFGYAAQDRAYKIAESETTRSQGFADVEAWKQSGQVTAKRWYTSKDERVCKFCGAMHNRTVSIDDNFYNKGDSMVIPRENKSDAVLNFNYEDIAHQPLHVRCRCVLLPVMKDL